jgi:hypothetical protein
MSRNIGFGQNLSRITGTSYEELCAFVIKCVADDLKVWRSEVKCSENHLKVVK